MTPEQNKRWRKAINPLDYLDFYACSKDGLGAFEKRLKAGKGAPLWAIKARQYYVAEGFNGAYPWAPDFALRSEVAMVGLKLLYPKHEDRADLYCRLLRDFLNRALAPFVADNIILQELHTLFSAAEQDEELLKQQCQIIRAREVELSRGNSFEANSASPVEKYLITIANNCVELVLATHFEPPKSYWNQSGAILAGQLLLAYKIRINEGGFSGSSLETIQNLGFQPVADALLAALETECPAPDWLPRE